MSRRACPGEPLALGAVRSAPPRSPGPLWRAVGLASLLLLPPLALEGCLVYGWHGVVVAPAPFAPLYYQGFVVYYDDDGLPVYYVDGLAHYVPRSYLHYHRLVRHYERHRAAYRVWVTQEPHHHVMAHPRPRR